MPSEMMRPAQEYSRAGRCLEIGSKALLGVPGPADDPRGFWCQRRLTGPNEIIGIECPFTAGGRIIIARLLPAVSRVLAGEHHDDRAVIPKIDAAPVLQQAQEIFQDRKS